jgi:hypothetical protein
MSSTYQRKLQKLAHNPDCWLWTDEDWQIELQSWETHELAALVQEVRQQRAESLKNLRSPDWKMPSQGYLAATILLGQLGPSQSALQAKLLEAYRETQHDSSLASVFAEGLARMLGPNRELQAAVLEEVMTYGVRQRPIPFAEVLDEEMVAPLVGGPAERAGRTG